MRLEVVDRIKDVIHDLWPSAEVGIIFHCKALFFFLIFLRLWIMTIFFCHFFFAEKSYAAHVC